MVIASCGNNLIWATRLQRSGLSVLVLESCPFGIDDHSKVLKRQVLTPPSLPKENVLPNCGREAHAYLHFILSHWHTLPRLTIFLQGDAPRHVSGHHAEQREPKAGWLPAELARLPMTAKRLLQERAAYAPLAGSLIPATASLEFKTLHAHCKLFGRFGTHGNAVEVRQRGGHSASLPRTCQIWRAFSHAHFAVSRERIHRLGREAYVWLQRWLFEPSSNECAQWLPAKWCVSEVGGACAPGHNAHASFMERSWGLVFGCADEIARPCQLMLSRNTTREELARACPHYLNEQTFRGEPSRSRTCFEYMNNTWTVLRAEGRAGAGCR